MILNTYNTPTFRIVCESGRAPHLVYGPEVLRLVCGPGTDLRFLIGNPCVRRAVWYGEYVDVEFSAPGPHHLHGVACVAGCEHARALNELMSTFTP